MAQTSLITNYADEKTKASAELGNALMHFANMPGIALQSINISGQGAVSITYTGAMSAAEKAHLGLS